jgi:hypothetical protein
MLRRTQRIPPWLRKAERDPERFLKRDLFSKPFLRDSLYYGCCSNDGRSIKHWGGLFHSYILVDSLYDDNAIESWVKPFELRGYSCFFRAKVEVLSNDEMRSVWQEIASELKETPLITRGEPSRPNTPFEIAKTLHRENPKCASNAYICLLRRKSWEGYGRLHGPRLLSVVCLSGGAASHYFHFYNKNRIVPRGICLHNPGMGDWIFLYRTDGIFYNLFTRNKAGLPLLSVDRSPFPEYSHCFYEEPNNWRVPSLWMLNEKLRTKDQGGDREDRPIKLPPAQRHSLLFPSG